MRQPSPALRAAQARLRELHDGTFKRRSEDAARYLRITKRLDRDLRQLDREAELDQRVRIGRQLVEVRDVAQTEFDRLMQVQRGAGLTQQEHEEAEHWQAELDAFDERWPDLEYEQRGKCRAAYARSLRARAAGAKAGPSV